MEKDQRWMKVIGEVGNGVHPSIEIGMEYLSMHGDGMLSILELKVRMEVGKGRREIERNGVCV